MQKLILLLFSVSPNGWADCKAVLLLSAIYFSLSGEMFWEICSEGNLMTASGSAPPVSRAGFGQFCLLF